MKEDKFMFKVKSYHEGHTNPLFYRENYTNLDGKWDFVFDKKNIGEKEKFFESFPKNHLSINVPYCYLTEASGINIKDRVDNIWYHRTINIKKDKLDNFLIFNGADFTTKLWVNSKFVGRNDGGYHIFKFNIEEYLVDGDNEITIKCEDDFSVEKPRGKQRFRKENFLCWYEETTGIYKSLYLEKVPKVHINHFSITPSFKNKTLYFTFLLSDVAKTLNIAVSYQGKLIENKQIEAKSNYLTSLIKIDDNDFHPWDVLDPKLYDISFDLEANDGIDHIETYAGIRDIYTKDSKVYLNNHELYQKLVLDQGYFDKGDLTPLNIKAYLLDINNMINMGFNGARKHQKRESSLFYYYADVMGFLVWAEMPSMYVFTKKSVVNFYKEWKTIIRQLYNHPSIIVWTPLNESWGVPFIGISKREQKFACDIYKYTKRHDSTRLVVSNDGWEQCDTDLTTLHFYAQNKEELKENINLALTKNVLKTYIKKKVSIPGYDNVDKPVLVTEFGGTSFIDNSAKTWGYGKNVSSISEYRDRLKDLFSAIKEDNRVVGYCYTQLSDVKQERNGLYTLNRTRKIDDETMKEIQR